MYLKDAKRMIKEVFTTQIETNERFCIELRSSPGVGKSEGIAQVAAELSEEWGEPVGLKDFFLSTLEPPDVRGFGLPGKDTDGSLLMQFTKAPWMPKKDDPKHGILLLDEFGQAQPDVAKPAAELLLKGRVGDSQLPITWIVVAASNREKDRSGVHKSLAFIENRRCVIEVRAHLDTWVEWAETHDVNPLTIAFAKWKPNLVFTDTVPDKGGAFCTPRTLCKLSHLIGRMDMELFTEAATGYIGGAGVEFVAFLRVAEECPKFEDIVDDPEKTPVPSKDKPDAQYAVMQMIAHRVDKKTAYAAFKYLKRMPKEFQVSGLKAALRRSPDMVQTTEFAQWLRDNRELVTAANVLDTAGKK